MATGKLKAKNRARGLGLSSTKLKGKSFELAISDDEDERRYCSSDLLLDDDDGDDVLMPDRPAHTKDDIVFAQDLEDSLFVPMDEDLNEDDMVLQGYDDYAAADNDSEEALQGYDDYVGGSSRDADYVPGPVEDEPEDDDYDEDAIIGLEPSAKRARTMAPSSKRIQPEHFHLTSQAAERSAHRVLANEDVNFLLDEDAALIPYTAPSRGGGKWGRWNREKGSTLPAYHKKVSHELDSDDQLMMDMRGKGYSDKEISQRLAKEGRVRYDPKSIATRVQRIRNTQAAHNDFLLATGAKEWRHSDDLVLLRAYDLAEIEIAYEIERIRAWRYRKTADWMRRLNKEVNFSTKACKARYAALMDGTAVIPCDVDADPEKRKAEMEKFSLECAEKRAREEEEKEAKEAERERTREEAQIRWAQRTAEAAEKNSAKAAADEARAVERANKKALRSQEAAEHERKAKMAAEEKVAKKKASEAERTHREKFSVRHFKHVTKDTPDPRLVLDVADIKKLCCDHKINDYTPRKMSGPATKRTLLERLQEWDECRKPADLIKMCKEANIPAGGSKLQMIHQLALFAAMSCDSYKQDEVQDDAGADGGDEAGSGMEIELS